MKKRLISIVLALSIVLAAMVGFTSATVKLTDIEGHWGQAYIERWVEEGVIGGYPDGTFRPDQFVTRAEVSKILATAYKMPAATTPKNFSDVPANAWFYDYVQACAAFGAVNGYPNGTFMPNGNITRSEAVKMVCVSAGLDLVDTGYEVFADAGKMPEWAGGYWNALIKAGVIDGYENGTLRPTDLITRAEMVKILCFAVKAKIYKLDVSIVDNLGNKVSDSASYLTGEAYLVDTLIPLLVANRENFAAVYPSGDMRDLLDAGIAIAKEGYKDGWTDEELATWNQYLTDGFSEVGGELSAISILSDVTTTIATVARDSDYIMTRFDTEEGRTDIQYTVTIRVEVMD
ncbi:MAG: S-layer homology domain-containing protein [Ruminococcaceae bacterium]|nr:S-layer homology domain-containing protein [Oscillospiraceae bacterium]